MIKIRNLTFEYFDRDDEGYLTDMVNAIRGINFDAKEGQIIAIAGRNGSGKSTLAKILNRLVEPMDGSIDIDGLDAYDADNTIEIRKRVGMVFQNPDDQLFGSIIGEDIAFGPENIGVPYDELWGRVYNAIDMVGMAPLGDKKKQREVLETRINAISGGEKQKVAIAGVLAMGNKCIILDESTSMLDGNSRKELLTAITKLNKDKKITVILITHLMEELLLADTIYIMDKGKIVARGNRNTILSDAELLEKYGLGQPPITKISKLLYDTGCLRTQNIYSIEEFVERLKIEHPYSFEKNVKPQISQPISKKIDPVNAILFNKVSFSYGKNKVVNAASFNIAKGDFAAIVGASGAGKTTITELMAGLLKPQMGEVYIDGRDMWDSTTETKQIRSKVGYLFQYPEHQLFAKNVYEDVVFGARNIGVSEVEAEKRAYEAIELVGLPQDIYDIPIDKLSGGQKRRVALAGVLAMGPEYLILDEPTAGLDPEGKKQMLNIIARLNNEAGITIVVVSHAAEEIAKYAKHIIFVNDGSIGLCGNPEDVFLEMCKNGYELYTPVIMQLLSRLRAEGMDIDVKCIDTNEGIRRISESIR